LVNVFLFVEVSDPLLPLAGRGGVANKKVMVQYEERPTLSPSLSLRERGSW
jgi:hypothetical protein